MSTGHLPQGDEQDAEGDGHEANGCRPLADAAYDQTDKED
jgi:hypothetical protein